MAANESHDQISALERARDEARQLFGRMFDENVEDPSKFESFLKGVFAFVEPGIISIEAFERCSELIKLSDRQQFVEGLLGELEPLLRFKQEHPREFRDIRNTTEMVARRYIRVNRVLSYEIDQQGWMRLHVPENEGENPLQLYAELRDGLRKLAAMIKEKPESPGLVGTSWIVARIPVLLERLGFTLEGSIDEAHRAKHFAKETRPIHIARMSREVLIERWSS